MDWQVTLPFAPHKLLSKKTNKRQAARLALANNVNI